MMEKKGVVDPSETPDPIGHRKRSEDLTAASKAEEDKRAASTINGLDDDPTKRLSDKAAESL